MAYTVWFLFGVGHGIEANMLLGFYLDISIVWKLKRKLQLYSIQ